MKAFLFPVVTLMAMVAMGCGRGWAVENTPEQCASAFIGPANQVIITNQCRHSINVSAMTRDGRASFLLPDLTPGESREAPLSTSDYEAAGGLALISCSSGAGPVGDDGRPWKDPDAHAVCVSFRISQAR